MTRNGIVYDLEKSPYTVTFPTMKFYFSSTNHLRKFKEMLIENRIVLSESLKNRFGVDFNIADLADLHLYGRVETRGFLIEILGVKHTCKKTILLSGELKTKSG